MNCRNASSLPIVALAAAILAASAFTLKQPDQPSTPPATAGNPPPAPEPIENLTAFAQAAEELPKIPVTIAVDAGQSRGPLKPIWRWCGYDEPNYTYAENGKKLVGQLTGSREEVARLGPAYFRAHSLLVTGDGTPHLKWGSTNAYTEDAAGNPVYSWTIVDKIFDTYINAGAKPYAQISFMPKALSLRPEPYEHNWKPGDPYGRIYTGWTTPPNNYDKWRELNYQWAKHCVEKYGQKEVESWYWEVWNECNIDYLSPSVRSTAATPQERNAEDTRTKIADYQKIWDYAADGIRKAIPNAIIGGAETAGDGGQFQRSFIEHSITGTNFATGQKGSPLGLVSFHAKGAPTNFQGHVRMGVQNQLATINAGFRIVASYPETAKLPVVIGESDPDGCAACQSYNGLYPEYGYRNSTLFASYTIEQLARTMDLAERNNVNLLGAVTWAFEFEDQPMFAGFRALATNGIAMPVLNTFRMLNKMGANRITADSTGDLGLDTIMGGGGRGRGAATTATAAADAATSAPATAAARGGGGGGGGGRGGRGGVRGDRPDISALASRDDRRITVITWNYHDDDVPGPAGDIALSVTGLPSNLTQVKVTEWRIDETHSNSFTAWKKMGSPEKPTPEQFRQLEDASALALFKQPANLAVKEGRADLQLTLPRQAISLVELSW